jgi:hypothetical protein
LKTGADIRRSAVVEALQAKVRDEKAGLAFIYFDYTNPEQQSALQVFRSIIRQLAHQGETVAPELFSVYQSLEEGRPQLKEMINCVKAISSHFSVTFIVMDSLDNCDDGERSIILNQIRRNLLPTGTFKIFATSKPHILMIQTYFQDALLIHIRSDPTEIERFVAMRVNEVIPHHPEEFKAKIIRKLASTKDT